MTKEDHWFISNMNLSYLNNGSDVMYCSRLNQFYPGNVPGKRHTFVLNTVSAYKASDASPLWDFFGQKKREEVTWKVLRVKTGLGENLGQIFPTQKTFSSTSNGGYDEQLRTALSKSWFCKKYWALFAAVQLLPRSEDSGSNSVSGNL